MANELKLLRVLAHPDGESLGEPAWEMSEAS